MRWQLYYQTTDTIVSDNFHAFHNWVYIVRVSADSYFIVKW